MSSSHLVPGNAFRVIGLAVCVLAGYAFEKFVRRLGSRTWSQLVSYRIALPPAVTPRLAARLG